jgi:hypothetical protein
MVLNLSGTKVLGGKRCILTGGSRGLGFTLFIFFSECCILSGGGSRGLGITLFIYFSAIHRHRRRALAVLVIACVAARQPGAEGVISTTRLVTHRPHWLHGGRRWRGPEDLTAAVQRLPHVLHKGSTPGPLSSSVSGGVFHLARQADR